MTVSSNENSAANCLSVNSGKDTADYNILLKARNNWLLQKMREAGYSNAAELSRASGVVQSTVGRYLNLKLPPLNHDGTPRQSAMKMAEALNCTIFDIFPPQHLEKPLQKNSAEFIISADDIYLITQQVAPPDASIEISEATGALDKLLLSLHPRYERAVRMSFLEGKTLEEVGSALNVSRERARQIIMKGIRRMRFMALRSNKQLGETARALLDRSN